MAKNWQEPEDLLNAPCIFCGYNGQGYFQVATHDKKCPWFELGGYVDRALALRETVKSILTQAKATWEAHQKEVDEAYQKGYEARKSEMCDHCDSPLLREGELYQKLDEAEQSGRREIVEWIKTHSEIKLLYRGSTMYREIREERWQAFLKIISFKPVKEGKDE